MKDLPKVTRGNISENINNTQDIYYGSDRTINKKDDLSIVKKINNIFASRDHVYKSRVKITFNNKVEEKVIVGKTSTNLITIDGELINILDILDIEKI